MFEPRHPSSLPSSGRAGTISVCHVASGDLWAGAEAQIAALLKAMVGRGDFRLSAIVLNEGRLAEEVRALGVEVKVIPERRMSSFEIFREASEFLRRKPVHVLHSHRYKENLLAVLLARRLHVPAVMRTEHGLPEPQVGFKRSKHKLLQWVDRITARYAVDCVVGVSAEMRDHLNRYVSPGKVAIIPYGLDVRRPRSTLTTAEAKQKLGVPSDCCAFGTAARLEPIKRLDIFLEAASQIAHRMPHGRFVIVGTGREEARLRQLARNLGIEDQVLFLGFRHDIYDVLRAMDIFVLCSDHEGFPMALLEALYVGVPVVARRVGGIPEIIQDGITGLLVDSGDPQPLAAACLSLAQNGELRKRLAQASPLHVAQNFSADWTAAKMTELYRSVCRV